MSDRTAGDERRWRRGTAAIIGGLLVAGVLVAFIVLPVAQSSRIGLDPWTAILRFCGIPVSQPVSGPAVEPVSAVAWTTEVIDGLASADPEAGAAAAQGCAACHGASGVSPSPAFPHLAGQSAYALYKQLHDFRSGSRVNAVMASFAAGLDDQAIIDLAGHYSALSTGTLDPIASVEDPVIRALVMTGDPARAIPACVSCHGAGVGGPIETPTIAGQQRDYLAGQLRLYASGERRNDIYGRMRAIAARLTDDEIDRLAAYYSAVPTQR